MNLITDRTEMDVLLKTAKGIYGQEDLNRVESAVEQLQTQARSLDIHLNLSTKTDWSFSTQFSTETWPTKQQMDRYLSNVTQLCDVCGIQASLPETMERLGWMGANQIEKALYEVQQHIRKIIQAYRFSGEVFAGEENIL